jgi:dienelactone hydrolase
VNATVDFLKSHPGVDGEQLGIVGFCTGGRVAYLMAVANPSFKAAAAYYGGNIMVPWGEGPSPFDRTREVFRHRV